MKKYFYFLLTSLVAILSCDNNKKHVELPDDTEVMHRNVKNLTDLIIYDIFSPPVASRIYSYTSLAAHETLRHIEPGEPSIVSKLNGFDSLPAPDKNKTYNYVLAASVAFYSTMRELTFSRDTISRFENDTYEPFKQSLAEDVYANSVAFGKAVASRILVRMRKDTYRETRAMQKFFGSRDDGKWQPTAEDYMDATEPYWTKIKSFTLDSSGQFNPEPPPLYSKDTASLFFKMNKEVYDITNNLTPEQKDIARFWDDNPFVSHHSGHLSFNTKKQTPGGHWMGITAIACRKTNAGAVKSARAYALVAVGMLDAFISCWDTKYYYSYIRPITAINQLIDKNWSPFLQTPPFPEYTSGHSTISSSAATILTGLFGENFSFHDDADKEYINMEKDFPSFMAASLEASISRLYGGIHYRISLDTGVEVGKKIGEQVLRKTDTH
jgi:hypothetical protein